MDIKIRVMEIDEKYLLDDFLYNAIFQSGDKEQLPRTIIKEPSLQVYVKDFGKKDDVCLVSEVDGKVVGCVWTRVFSNELKGYGSTDDKTPELAISVLKRYRKKGIGTKLMNSMLIELKNRGYSKVSLSVQKKNYALKMYERLGFLIIREDEEEVIMVHKLKLED